MTDSTPQPSALEPIEARREKLHRLVERGVNPYPTEAVERTPIEEVRAELERSCPESDTEDTTSYQIAGRVTAIRGQGGIIFLDLMDGTGSLQLVAKEDVVQTGFDLLPDLDLGDIIAAKGTGWRTRRGELSLKVTELRLLAKSLRPLPSSWHGLKDHEQRYRQRYVDLLVNQEVRDFFRLRSRFMASVRRHLIDKFDFTEVETPTLEEVPGGADAEPFATHHNALDVDYFLRISLELHLKRLVVGGFEKVFELGSVFRNEGVSPQHLQEFTMLEFYWAYADYLQLMTMVEELYAGVIKDTFGGTTIERAGKPTLDFTPTWKRVDYVDAIKEATGVDVLAASDEDILEAIKKHRVDTDLSLGRARLIDQLYKKTVRPNLKEVCFLVDPPLVMSPLAKPHRDDPRRAERFWVLADGAEIGNAFSELNDPIDQYARLTEQEELRLEGDVEAQRLDRDFIRALQYGMPPTAGFGVGIDRWLYVLTGQDSIRDTVLFPNLRPEPAEELADVDRASRPLGE